MTDITMHRRRRLIKRDGVLCCYCEKQMRAPRSWRPNWHPPDLMTIEHVVRRADGGTNSMSNLKLACMDCNTNRGERSFEEWRKTRQPYGTTEQRNYRRWRRTIAVDDRWLIRDRWFNESYLESFT